MRNPEGMFEFSNGKIVALQTVPEWVKNALVEEMEHDDRDRALTDQGADNVETYGMLNETIDVWRMLGHGWLVDWWDTDSHIMSVYISNLIDFANFQATWVAPMALKIMAADDYIRNGMTRQAEAERKTSSLH